MFSFIGRVFQNGKPIIVINFEVDKQFYPGVDKITGKKTTVCVTIERVNRILGVIEAINNYNGVFDEEDLRLLQAIARYAGIAIENAKIHSEIEKNMELSNINGELESFRDITTYELKLFFYL